VEYIIIAFLISLVASLVAGRFIHAGGSWTDDNEEQPILTTEKEN
jgi:hypothetical protein